VIPSIPSAITDTVSKENKLKFLNKTFEAKLIHYKKENFKSKLSKNYNAVIRMQRSG